MPFEFVDNAAIGSAARRRIRSHVAMGKNVGKTLMRPSKTRPFGRRAEVASAPILMPRPIEKNSGLERRQNVPQIERQIGDGLSVLSLPAQPLRSEGLVQRVISFINMPRHSPELSNALDATASPASLWVRFMFLDEAYFHCVVAVGVTALNNLVTRPENTTEAMQHLSQTFQLVNKRLSGDEAISDTTIAVIVMMAKYEPLQGRYIRGLVHLEGLQRMVAIRGGLSRLAKSTPGLAQKIIRIDLEYALHLGSSTRFSIDDIVPNSTAIVGLPSSSMRQYNGSFSEVFQSRFSQELTTDLYDLLIDIISVSRLLNDANIGLGPKLDSYAFHDTVLLLGYRLVHISPLGEPCPAGCFENTVYWGLTAFLMTFLRELDGKMSDVGLLSEKARLATHKCLGNEKEDQELLLWILFMGGASILEQWSDAWLIPRIAQTLRALGLYTWEDVGQVLFKFPWINAIHDKAGHALWQMSNSSTDSEPNLR